MGRKGEKTGICTRHGTRPLLPRCSKCSVNEIIGGIMSTTSPSGGASCGALRTPHTWHVMMTRMTRDAHTRARAHTHMAQSINADTSHTLDPHPRAGLVVIWPCALWARDNSRRIQLRSSVPHLVSSYVALPKSISYDPCVYAADSRQHFRRSPLRVMRFMTVASSRT